MDRGRLARGVGNACGACGGHVRLLFHEGGLLMKCEAVDCGSKAPITNKACRSKQECGCPKWFSTNFELR